MDTCRKPGGASATADEIPSVILEDLSDRPAAASLGAGATLDVLFRRAVERRPDAIALIDPPNRESFTDGRPRRLRFAQIDRMVSAIAGRLRQWGCTPMQSSPSRWRTRSKAFSRCSGCCARG
jgi:hypothetical protein